MPAPDQADAFFTDRYGTMSDIPDRSYQSLLKTKRDIVNLQELDSARAQQARSIQQERQEPPREPNLPALGPMVVDPRKQCKTASSPAASPTFAVIACGGVSDGFPIPTQ